MQQVHERFYRTLALVSAKAAETGCPWWYYPLVGEHFDPTSFHYPIAREEYIRFAVFSALAYGARGLVEWRFLEIPSDKDNLWYDRTDEKNYRTLTYLRHPVRANRMRTPVWEYLRRVNAEVRCFQSIFLNAEVKNVYHTNLYELSSLAYKQRDKFLEYGADNNDPKYLEEKNIKKLPDDEQEVVETWGLKAFPSNNDSPLLSVECKGISPCNLDKGSAAKTLGVMVSHLRDERTKTDYVVIVSHDAECYQEVTLSFKNEKPVFRLDPLPNANSFMGTALISKNNVAFTFLLPPGGYLIFST